MFRCNYCPNLAMFECSNDKFCRPHRSKHDLSHKGDHKFNDVYCTLTDNQIVELTQEITIRIKTLKECKKAFSQFVAESIQKMQSYLAQTLANLDELQHFYIDLIQKKFYDENEFQHIEQIFQHFAYT